MKPMTIFALSVKFLFVKGFCFAVNSFGTCALKSRISSIFSCCRYLSSFNQSVNKSS